LAQTDRDNARPLGQNCQGAFTVRKRSRPLFIRTANSLVPTPGVGATPEDEVVIILRLLRTPELVLDGPLSAEWCEGEVW
jgi:hypothetical protein